MNRSILVTIGVCACASLACAKSVTAVACEDPPPYLHVLNEGALYAGTVDGGGWSWTRLHDVPCISEVSALTVQKTGAVWLASSDGHLARVDRGGTCELVAFRVGPPDTTHTSIAFLPGASGEPEQLFAFAQRGTTAPSYTLYALDPYSGASRVVGAENVDGEAISLSATGAGELFLFRAWTDYEWRLSRLDPETGVELEGWAVGGVGSSIRSLVRYRGEWIGAGFVRCPFGGNLQLWRLDLATTRVEPYGHPPDAIGEEVVVGTSACPPRAD